MRAGLAAAACVAVCSGPASAAPPDVIRTGGPSRPADSKVAVVATARNMVGRRFRVIAADGQTVLTARVTRAPGVHTPWRRAGLADLSAVTAPGSYAVALGRLRSRPWVVA